MTDEEQKRDEQTPGLKAGIVVDDYKIEKFKAEFEAAGFRILSIDKLTHGLNGTSNIRVWTPPERILEIKAICTKCELHFKRSN